MFSKRSRDASLVHANPPAPTMQPDATGQRLLGLLKALDKNKEDEGVLLETLGLMQKLIAVVRRRGFLRGNAILAEQILASAAGTGNANKPAAAGGSSNNNHRKKSRGKRGRSSNELTMLSGAILDVTGPAAALDAQLVMAALARVLETPKPCDGPAALTIVVAAAADVVTAACEHIKSRLMADACFLAEYELVAGAGKGFLVGVEKHVRGLLPRQRSATLLDGDDDDEEALYAMAACFRAASALVSVFGTKLSRSTAILVGLRDVAWEAVLTVDDGGGGTDFVVHAATILLATLPYAGGTDKLTPSLVWNQAVVDAVSGLKLAMRKVAPLAELKKHGAIVVENAMSDYVRQVVYDPWISKIEQASSDDSKARIFVQLVQRLGGTVVSLLSRDAISAAAAATSTLQAQLIGAEVNADSMLSLVEAMLSFSPAAEAKYYGTKKRLRLEAVDGGLLSPAALAGRVAMAIRLAGHNLLDATVSALGAASLLPYARRVLRIAQIGLLTSSSSALRRVLDPSSAAQLDGKWKRWLHTSITARIAAVKTFHQAVLVFGIDPRSLTASSTNRSGGDGDRAVTVICGHIIEELSSSTVSVEWGSLDDRVQLVSACCESLAACLSSGGEFLPMSTRGLVDSVTRSCLESVFQAHPFSFFSIVKTSILTLGSLSVCTPWQDGAASCIAGQLKKVARACQQDRESSVVLVATSALRVCDALDCPRVPAMNVVTRSDAFLTSGRLSTTITAEAMVDKLQAARDDIERMKTMVDSEKSEAQATPPKKPEVSLLDPQVSKDVVAPAVEMTILAVNRNDEKRLILENVSSPQDHGEPMSDEGIGDCAGNAPSNAFDNGCDLDIAPMDEDDDDFPVIVDCGPDEDDE